ncbi:hypothetical protein OSTOST_20058 [Ostertagia ostertagi]
MSDLEFLIRRKKRHKPCPDDIPAESLSVESFLAGSEAKEEPQELCANIDLSLNGLTKRSRSTKVEKTTIRSTIHLVWRRSMCRYRFDSIQMEKMTETTDTIKRNNKLASV